MKRQLSLVLALVMILGTFTSVFAADAKVDAVKEASEFLVKQEVLVGDTKGNLNLDDALLRQDTVVLVAKLMGEHKVAKDFPVAEGVPTYKDVRDPFYLPLLAWAQANKTFVGHDEAKFGFGEKLTAQEYAKVLLVALDYTVGPNGDVDVAWKDALVKAKDLGILANVDVKDADEILRSDVAVMTFNALSVKMKGSDKTLAEKLGIEMPAAKELTAKVNDTVNLKEVVLELSNAKLVNKDKLEDKNNYRVEKFKVEKATVEGDNVVLLLDSPLVKNRTYDLSVRGLDRVIDKTYTFKALDNASPEVVAVTVLGEYGIKVTTSEPVKDPQERDFLVDGKNVAMKLETYGRDIILTPYYNTSFASNAETLTVKGLEDFAGFKSALADFEIEVVKDEVAPKVTKVTVDGKVVEVTFDKDIYERSVGAYENARDEGNIFYRSGRLDIFAKKADKVDTNKVKYTFDENLPRRTDVTIVDVQNHSKVAMERTTMEAIEKKDNLEPIIVDFDVKKDVPNKEATITIEFDKDIDKDSIDMVEKSFAKNDNFKLFTEKVLTRYEADANAKIKSVNYDGTKKDTIIVVLEGLKENVDNKYDYILEVRNFEDESGNRMYTDYIEFDLSEEKVLEVTNITIKELRDETEIAIDFSRSVDRVRAEDKTNYLFRKNSATDTKVYDVANLDGEVIVESNGKTVTLKLPKFEGKGYDYLEILKSIRDKDGNRLTGRVNFDLRTVEADFKAAAKLVEAQNAVKALFADYSTKAALATGVDQAKITAALSKVQALPSSTTKSGLLTDISKAQNLLANAGILNAALAKINAAATLGTTNTLVKTDFDNAGVIGVTTGNVGAVNTKLASLSTVGVNPQWNTAALQGVVNQVLAEASITTAVGLLPVSVTVAEGVDTNLLTKFNAISGMAAEGVTLTLDASGNANVDNSGLITYTGVAVTGNVIVKVNKGTGAEQTKTISVAVPQELALSNPTVVTGLQEGQNNVAAGSDITAALSASGGDGSFTYSVEGPDAAKFVIASGKVQVGTTALTAGTYNITVKVTDGNNATVTKDVVVIVAAP